MRPSLRCASAVRRGVAVAAALAAAGVMGAGAGPGRADAPAAGEVPRNAGGYRHAAPPWEFRFPRDHGAHPEFRTEWWYYTGHLEAGGSRWGYELVFFRVGLDRARAGSPSAWAPHTVYLAHAALTDPQARRFLWDERIARPALGQAGADTGTLRVWVDDWGAERGADGRHRLRAVAGGFALELELEPVKAPAVHGDRGVSRKGAGVGQASHYYSLTRLATRGRLTAGDGRVREVRGESWMDHEFSSAPLDSAVAGWDWFSLQLDDGRELMLYVLRRRDGGPSPVSSGTLVATDGRTTHLPRDRWSLETSRLWRSPHTGGEYPSGWVVRVPGEGIELVVEPVLADQELQTRKTGGIVYWEGSVSAAGRDARGPLRGRGYVELTGYVGRAPGS